MNASYEYVQDLLNTCTDTKGSSYSRKDKNATVFMYSKVVEFLENNGGTLETRFDGSLGQLYESMVKRVLFGYENGYYSKANSVDYKMNKNKVVVDVKVSTNCKDLCTPIKSATKIMFITPQGAYLIDKKTIKEVLENVESYDCVKYKYPSEPEKGIVLKLNAIELGEYQAELSKGLGL